MVQLLNPYMTPGKIIALTRQTFVGKVISLLFNILSGLVIAFLPRSKHLLILWLQSQSTVILESKKIKYVTVSIFFPIYLSWRDRMSWSSCFEYLILSQFFHSPLSPSSRGSLVPLHFLPLEWCHLHIWACWYFSWESWFQLVIHPAQHLTWCTVHIS